MKLTNKFNLPEPVVKALTRNEYSKGESNRSVTQLIDSPRVRILRQENWDSLTEDVSEKLWAVFGTAVHKMFEVSTSGNDIPEERVFLDVEGWTISGAIDVQSVDGDGVILRDYKTTSVWSVIFGKDEWVNQLNSYASLVRRAKGVKVKGLKVVAILRDWKNRDAEEKQDYPKAPIMEIDIPMWSEEEQDRYLDERVTIHQNAEFDRLTGAELPLCSREEMWEKSPKWAVKKTGNKRALRVYDDELDALSALKEGQEIEFRRGEPTRCVGNWCRVNEFCSQYKKMTAESLDSLADT